MKRSGFKRPTLPRRSRDDTFENFTSTPRPTAQASAQLLPSPPILKFAYVRDKRLREMCRGMSCQWCGCAGPDAGVTWAHSNQAIHGKGKACKASDVYVAALCHTCHVRVDQGSESREARQRIWLTAHLKTVALAVSSGSWPPDINIPAYG